MVKRTLHLEGVKILLLITLSLNFLYSNAQQHPFHLKWKKIKTEHFEIVFPDEITEDGQRMANTLEFLYKPESITLGQEAKRISVFLSNQTSISNGYVSNIPRKSVFYTQPLQDATQLGSQDWLETLAVHEFRHVVQSDLSYKNFSKLAGIFYGSYGRVGATYSEPLWYSEGDAVVTETVYSQLGRGRIPAFIMPIKAQVLSNQKLSYQKQYLGSYKNYSPSHYPLGYLLEMQKRNEFSDNINHKIIKRSTLYSYLPYAYSLAQKKETKYNAVNFYNYAFAKYKKEWQNEINNKKVTAFTIVSKLNKYYTNYEHPQKLGNSIYALKSGIDDAKILIKIDANGNESKVKQIFTDQISASGASIVWDSYAADLRWGEKSYSNIYRYDTLSNKVSQLTFRKKYFAPSLSPDQSMIACVEFTNADSCNLLISNAYTGEIFKKIASPNNDFIRTPKWSADGKKILFSHSSTQGQALSEINIVTLELNELMPYNFKNISQAQYYKNYILFNMPCAGTGNICALDTLTNEIFQITESKFGAYHASIFGESLIYQNYTSKGHQIVSADLSLKNWKVINKSNHYNKKLITNVLQQEDSTKILGIAEIPDVKYEITKYNKLLNSLNIHAWGVYPGEEEMDFSIISDNKLNTINLQAGIAYNYAKESYRKYTELEFSALFPVFHISVNTENQSQTFTQNDIQQIVNWKENSLTTGIYLPLNFSKNSQYSELTLGSYFQSTERIALESIGDYKAKEGFFTPWTNYLIFQIYQRSAKRDVAPRLGLYTKFLYRNTPFKQAFKGEQKAFISSVYLPGLMKNHSIKLESALEIKESDFIFSNQFIFPRGYEITYFDMFIKLSLNYQLPLLYPDLNIGNFLYIQRLRANIFYDYGFGNNNIDGGNGSITYKSLGAEIWFDFNVFNIKYDFNAGVRYSHRLLDNQSNFEFLMLEIPIGNKY